jgi:hypothetical protein
MMRLADHQRALLALMRGRAPTPTADLYVARVTGSRELAFLREVSLFWCALGVRSTCPWMTRWLERQGRFDASITAFHAEVDVSPYIETAGRQFLSRFLVHPDPLAAALAGFEIALLRIQAGEAGLFRVEWDRDPNAVIRALRTREELPDPEPDRIYVLEISRAFPELLRCDVVETTAHHGNGPSIRAPVLGSDNRRSP